MPVRCAVRSQKIEQQPIGNQVSYKSNTITQYTDLVTDSSKGSTVSQRQQMEWGNQSQCQVSPNFFWRLRASAQIILQNQNVFAVKEKPTGDNQNRGAETTVSQAVGLFPQMTPENHQTFTLKQGFQHQQNLVLGMRYWNNMMDHNFSPRDKIRLLTLEQHIKQHDYSRLSSNTHNEPGHCLICRNILEHCSDGDKEEEEDGCYTSRSSVISSSSCLPKSSSSRSSSISSSSQYNWLRELHRKIRREEEAAGKVVGNKSSNHNSKSRTRERRHTACEHLLQKKHKYCSVCYLCTRCGEVFLRYPKSFP